MEHGAKEVIQAAAGGGLLGLHSTNVGHAGGEFILLWEWREGKRHSGKSSRTKMCDVGCLAADARKLASSKIREKHGQREVRQYPLSIWLKPDERVLEATVGNFVPPHGRAPNEFSALAFI